nr:MAG TPA: ribosome, tRNA, helicase, RIBOSOME [Caudoviricetes sp.]
MYFFMLLPLLVSFCRVCYPFFTGAVAATPSK